MIFVKNLTKIYKTPKRENGFAGFVGSIFNRQYTNVAAVDGISFEVKEGELVGFLGPNGAGKTTTMKMLSGVVFPTKGEISVMGYNPFDKKHTFLKRIAFVMGQRNQLLWELPAKDTFRLNKEIYGIENKKYNETLDKLIRLLNCEDFVDRPIKTLSLGERMKMELVASLLHKPQILFLDEPTIGLDVVAQKAIRDFIKDYQRMTGATIILTSHYMEDVRALAGRIMIIDNGKIIYDGTLDALIKKYATRKTIEVIVEDLPQVKLLQKLSISPKVDLPRLIFQVRRAEVPARITEITKYIPFVDLNIYEEKIEDIVRKIFSENASSS